jgi:hypothetical protein
MKNTEKRNADTEQAGEYQCSFQFGFVEVEFTKEDFHDIKQRVALQVHTSFHQFVFDG